MKAPHFSLRRFIASFTLVTIGTALITWSFTAPHTQLKHDIGRYIDLTAFPLVGAGLFLPFRRAAMGALLFFCLGVMFPTICDWIVAIFFQMC